MRKLIAVAVIAVVATLFGACGGGGGGGGTPTGTLLGPDGTTRTSFNVNDPIAALFTGLSSNARYTVRLLDPAGTAVCNSTVYSGADGAIPASPYCFLQDMDTTRWGADGRVNTSLGKDGILYDELGEPEIDGAFELGKAVTTGDYTLELLDDAGELVLTKSLDDMDIVPLTKAFPVTSTNARACASNAAGLCARSFLKTTSNVFVTIEEGSGVSDGTVVDIYVVSDRCSVGWTEGMTLQPVASLFNQTVTYAGGLFTTIAAVWPNPATTGTFDVVVDVDRSGTYTAGDLVEILDQTDPGGLCAPGFTVQDAYSAGTDVIMQIAMDANRAYQDVFSIANNEDIYAQVQSQRRLVHKFGVKKYVVAHQDTWTDGDVLVDVIPPTLDVVQTGCTNQQRRLVAPINLMSPGCYDIVFDVDGDGVYDSGGDAVDNIDLNGANTCGFIVAGGDGSLTIDAITNNEGTNVKNSTSDSLTSKVTITGTVSGFSDGVQVTAYAVNGAQQGGAISGVIIGGAFTIVDMPLMAGDNVVKVFVREGSKAAVGLATVTWNPGGASGNIDIYATITWLTSTDMDTHFIKTAGVYTGKSASTNYQDCHYTNCTQDSGQALLWTTNAGSQTTSSDTNGAVARLDLDCIGCPAKTENVWIFETSGVTPTVGNFLLCVVAFSGTDTPSAAVSINGVNVAQLTAPGPITSGGNDMWFVGYVAQDASGNLQWNTANQIGAGAAVCKQP